MILESIAFEALDLPKAAKLSLIKKHGSARAVFEAASSRRGLLGKEDEVLAKVKKGMDFKAAERIQKKAERLGARILPFGDKDYPNSLCELHDPPYHLYIKGHLPDFVHPLALIGTRTPTPYGNRIARMMAQDLVREGVLLISGLARGIDAIAHEISVKEEKPTIAVMGTGIDRVYPREHQLLHDQILSAGGAILTEFAPGTPPRGANFPQRNRIIAALGKGILVIEAGDKSGTRSTVGFGLDLGRDVFAVSGPIDAPLSRFPNQLIADGACLVSSTSAILSEWKIESRQSQPSEGKPNSLPEDLGRVARHLDPNEPRSVEDLSRRGAGDAGSLLRALTQLELEGWVERHSDGQFILTRALS